MDLSLQEVWERILHWFARNAPQAAFGPPANDGEVFKTETVLSLTFPDDVRDSYRVHNGMVMADVSFFENMYLMSLEGIIESWTMWAGFLDRGELENWKVAPEQTVKSVRWNKRWVPLLSDTVGEYVAVDLDPSLGGNVGQVIRITRSEGPQRVLAKSWHSWLSQYAIDLESGRYVLDEGGSLLPS